MDTIVRGKHSITEKIRYSEDFSEIFEREVQALVDSPIHGSKGIRNLCNGKHRFDSLVKPMVRAVLLFDALLATAVRIMVLRHGQQESADAGAFIVFVSGDIGMERLVLFAMITDAGEICMVLLRFFDTEAYDAADIVKAINAFIKKLDWAFVCGNITDLETSYTYHMLTLLSRTRTINVKGKPHTIGDSSGVPPTCLRRCLHRMCSLVVMMIAVVKAELPAWEVLQCFSILNLTEREPANTVSTKLERAAITFGLDCATLTREFNSLLFDARRLHANDLSQPTMQVWQAAYHARCQGKPDELPTLRAFLARHGAYSGCTTSGVEQCHTLQDWLWPKRRGHLSIARENDEMKIVMDGTDDDPFVLEIAQGLWPLFYGNPRHRIKSRSDKGSKRGAVLGTLAEFTRVGRAALGDAVAGVVTDSMSNVQRRAASQTGATWTDAMTHEVEFQHIKRKDHFLNSLTDGTLLPSEVKPCDIDDGQVRLAHLMKKRTERAKAAAKKRCRLLPKCDRSTLKLAIGTRLYIRLDAATIAKTTPSPYILAQQRAMPTVSQPLDAKAFVVASPANPGLDIAWTTALNGGTIVDLPFFMSNGERGSSLRFMSALTTGGTRARPRTIWCSPKFRRQQLVLYNILRASVAKPYSMWRETTDMPTFAAEVSKYMDLPKKQQRPLQAIALIAEGEELLGNRWPKST